MARHHGHGGVPGSSWATDIPLVHQEPVRGLGLNGGRTGSLKAGGMLLGLCTRAEGEGGAAGLKHRWAFVFGCLGARALPGKGRGKLFSKA